MKNHHLISVLFLLVVFACKKDKQLTMSSEKVSFKNIEIIKTNTSKMLVSYPTAFGINVSDTDVIFDINKERDYEYDNYYRGSRVSIYEKKVSFDSIKVIVDTSKKIHINQVDFNEQAPKDYKIIDSVLKPGGYYSDYKYNFDEVTIEDSLLRAKNIHLDLIPVYIYNYANTDRIINFPILFGEVFMIMEAKNIEGRWKPIEYWDIHRGGCGTGHYPYSLKPKKYIVSAIRKYEGGFKTDLRVKLTSYDNIYYSNEFKGEINYSQFDDTKVKAKFKKRFGDYQNIDYDMIIENVFFNYN